MSALDRPALAGSLDDFATQLQRHRARYVAFGKGVCTAARMLKLRVCALLCRSGDALPCVRRRVLWLQEDVLEVVARCLQCNHVAWIDNFVLPAQVLGVRAEIQRLRDEGRLTLGQLGQCPTLPCGSWLRCVALRCAALRCVSLCDDIDSSVCTHDCGASASRRWHCGKEPGYNDRARRDLIGWFNGNEPGHEFEFLRWFGKKVPLVFAVAALATTTRCHGGRCAAVWPAQVGTPVSDLGAQVPELKNIAGRSKYMVCTAPACCSRDLAHVGAGAAQTTIYPGGGARYTVYGLTEASTYVCWRGWWSRGGCACSVGLSDNANKNGRRLTAILYASLRRRRRHRSTVRLLRTPSFARVCLCVCGLRA